jgi:hypothetical protein
VVPSGPIEIGFHKGVVLRVCLVDRQCCAQQEASENHCLVEYDPAKEPLKENRSNSFAVVHIISPKVDELVGCQEETTKFARPQGLG